MDYLDLKMDAAHHLTTRTLSNELGDQPISNRNVAPNGPCWSCEPLQSCHRPCLVTTASFEGQPGLLDCPEDLIVRALLACSSRISVTERQVPLDEPPFREHDISRSLYLGDKVSIVRSFRSA